MSNEISYDIEKLRYVGEKRAKLYRKLYVFTIKDLLYYCPKSYIDLSRSINIVDANIDEIVAIKARVIVKRVPIRTSRKGLVIYKIDARDATSDIIITLFNEPYTFKKIEVNREYIFYGKIKQSFYDKRHCYEMTSPIVHEAESKYKFIPVYGLTAGLTSKIISRNAYDALSVPGVAREYLPQWILKEANLIDLWSAFKYIHFPQNEDEIVKAKKRIVFDELFVFSLGLVLIKKNNLKSTSFVMKDVDLSDFYKELPFELTKAQKKVIGEISNDMQRNTPMNRLLQGDVGSGKTVVAMASMYLAFKNGVQSAFMVPTEILARQHYDLILKLLQPLGLNVGLLVGSMTQKQKEKMKDRLMLGMLDVIVGTHALIQDNVIFKNLGLVIADEQHRFGVKQRAKLSEKGQEPHKLIMSATPIPRTLSMIIYGDLDISIIDSLPSNRKKVVTLYVDGKKRGEAYRLVKKFVDEGRQAYIICPVVEQSETIDVKSVIEYGKELKDGEFKDYKVEIIHGKTRAYDKDEIMRKFKAREIDILIATTVIEVGIDVANATVMVIEDAHRFGLSQLHQLRGRVGRGEHQSYCMLISDSNTQESVNKLKIMSEIHDGFKISEYDLEIRGPGDFFGNRQHGLPQFKNSDMIKDVKLLKLSQDIVTKVLEKDVNLESEENKYLKEIVFNMIENISF